MPLSRSRRSACRRNESVWFQKHAAFNFAERLAISAESFDFSASHVENHRKTDFAIGRCYRFEIDHAVSILRLASRRGFGRKLRSLDGHRLMLIGWRNRQPDSDVRSWLEPTALLAYSNSNCLIFSSCLRAAGLKLPPLATQDSMASAAKPARAVRTQIAKHAPATRIS